MQTLHSAGIQQWTLLSLVQINEQVGIKTSFHVNANPKTILEEEL